MFPLLIFSLIPSPWFFLFLWIIVSSHWHLFNATDDCPLSNCHSSFRTNTQLSPMRQWPYWSSLGFEPFLPLIPHPISGVHSHPLLSPKILTILTVIYSRFRELSSAKLPFPSLGPLWSSGVLCHHHTIIFSWPWSFLCCHCVLWTNILSSPLRYWPYLSILNRIGPPHNSHFPFLRFPVVLQSIVSS